MSSNRATIIALYQAGKSQSSALMNLDMKVTARAEVEKKQQILLGPVKGSKSAFSETRPFQ